MSKSVLNSAKDILVKTNGVVKPVYAVYMGKDLVWSKYRGNFHQLHTGIDNLLEDKIGTNNLTLVNMVAGKEAEIVSDGIVLHGGSRLDFIGTIPETYAITFVGLVNFVPLTTNQSDGGWHMRLWDTGNNSGNGYPCGYVWGNGTWASPTRPFSLWGHGFDGRFSPDLSPEDGKLFQVVYRFDGTKIDVFFNGVLARTRDTSVKPTSVPVTSLGGRRQDSLRCLDGKICMYGVSEPLTDEEIAWNYELDKKNYGLD